MTLQFQHCWSAIGWGEIQRAKGRSGFQTRVTTPLLFNRRGRYSSAGVWLNWVRVKSVVITQALVPGIIWTG